MLSQFRAVPECVRPYGGFMLAPTHSSIEQIYLTALLLTGTSQLAEAALLHGIEAMNDDEPSGNDLLHHAIAAAIAPRGDSGAVDLKAAETLPEELQRVLFLAPSLRQSYVLRTLLGWPRDVCARMLRLSGREVDENAGRAAHALAFGY